MNPNTTLRFVYLNTAPVNQFIQYNSPDPHCPVHMEVLPLQVHLVPPISSLPLPSGEPRSSIFTSSRTTENYIKNAVLLCTSMEVPQSRWNLILKNYRIKGLTVSHFFPIIKDRAFHRNQLCIDTNCRNVLSNIYIYIRIFVYAYSEYCFPTVYSRW